MSNIASILQCDVSNRVWAKNPSESSLQLFVEPGTGISPSALGGAFRQAKHLPGLGVGEAGKEPQADQFGSLEILGRQFVNRFTDGDQVSSALEMATSTSLSQPAAGRRRV